MIKSLQSLRFFFALMIFHHHFFMNPQVIQFGLFPVAFFFILSGFVMTIGYSDKVVVDTFCYKQYITKRLIRIIPLNAICLALYLLIPLATDVVNHRLSLSTYILSIPDLMLIQAWIPIKAVYFSNNSVAWFLSDMLFCYLLFPVIMKWMRGRNGLFFFVSILIAYFIVIPFIKGDSIHALLYISPFFRIVDFLLGIMLCLILKQNLEGKRKPLAGTAIEVFALSIAIFAIVAFPKIPIVYSTASFYWVPSVVLIMAFAISAKWGGHFLVFYQNRFLFISGR